MAAVTFDEAATSQAAITVTVTSSQSEKMVTTSSSTSTSTATATSGVSTSSGAIITQTLPPGAGQTGGTTSSSSISGGAIAGIVIGTLLAIGLIISVILWLFCVRRRRENDTKIDVNGYEPPAPTPSFHSAIQSPPMTYQGGMSMNGGAMGTNDRYRLNVPGFTDSRMKKDVVIYPNGDRAEQYFSTGQSGLLEACIENGPTRLLDVPIETPFSDTETGLYLIVQHKVHSEQSP
ncbi:predicted protein [Histoplasma mississippiense (nom. inval.)]|uniref:predicted protein n=1 Tax=Ajellomyces capsulatus (strain NAm1 / WU24) TaxID=2059318 RepID=UPI000157B4CD|nr:predicted protein [Histoplasma mississippiense (nom. inval.)]EDN02801.1 predicted protein [Histoplasma mississippiense (nom. inval.)]